MRVSITGVPGTGKTTVSELVAGRLGAKVVHLTQFAKQHGLVSGYDRKRQCPEVDVEKLARLLVGEKDVVFESHYAEQIPSDVVVVLRLHPAEIVERLKQRGYSQKKVYENALAEALDTYEGTSVDTTGLTPEEVADKVIRAIKTKKGDDVDWSDWLEHNLKQLEKLGL